MSIVGTYVRGQNGDDGHIEPLKLDMDKQMGIKNTPVYYIPTDAEKALRAMILQHFTLGYTNMYTPRVEFNDLSVIERTMVDQMAFNTYQPNNGEGYPGDAANNWRSRAVRPIVRNKCISIAAHATAQLIFPKIFAWDNQSDSQQDAAQVMMDLMEWAADQSNYPMTSLYATLSALVNPCSIVYTEFADIFRTVKRGKEDGEWTKETIQDEILSGFKDAIISPDEMYIENFFEPDIQKQSWLVWRRVISYQMAEGIFGQNDNFKSFVKPGMQVVFNDANQSFYWAYDPNMRPYMVEWVRYYNRQLDLEVDMVNGVIVCDPEQPIRRNDKLYPFAKFGYELINNRCFYYKSLAFKTTHDAQIINTLYPMIVDGTYLNLMPPFVNTGEDIIGSDVIVPGQAITLKGENAQLSPIKVATDLKSGMDTLFKVEESITQSSGDQMSSSDQTSHVTAYAIAQDQKQESIILGLFVQMISSFVKQYGRLRLGDIMQFMTIADVDKLVDDPELIYKTFLIQNRKVDGQNRTRKIQFDSSLPTEPISQEDHLKLSYEALKNGGLNGKTELWRVNPELFRNLKYMIVVSPDVMNPMSQDVERAYNLEVYDRAVQNPAANQQAVLELLLQSTPTTQKDPKKFIAQEQPGQQPGQPPMQPNQQAQQAMSLKSAPQPTQMPNVPQISQLAPKATNLAPKGIR